MNLEEENKKLKIQLKHAKEWMKREISVGDSSSTVCLIEEKIYKFFPSEALSYFPSNAVENIVSAETIFQHLILGEELDGMSIIISYTKVIDEMLELYVTKGFRKYIFTNKAVPSHVNTPLEKSFRLLIEKKHTLSIGRLYQSLQCISKGGALSPYLSEFSKYLKSRSLLEKSLMDTSFLLQLKYLIHSHAFTDKRHSGILSKADTIKARKCIIGNFEDTHCILYILADSLSTES